MIPNTKRHPTLETERLRLDPLAPADVAQLIPLMDDREVMAYWDAPAVEDPDRIAAIVENQVAAMAAGIASHWTVRSLADDVFLGCCSLPEIDRGHKRGEVGFVLGRGAWGAGHALEAMRLVVAYAASSGLRKLAARTHLGHRRSDALLEELGFKQQGLLRGHVLRDGERRDCRLFGLML